MRTFTVRGTGEFPLDMLRHDECWPATSSDATSIGLRYGLPGEEALRRPRLIALYCTNRPHILRWNSFGWRVEAVV